MCGKKTRGLVVKLSGCEIVGMAGGEGGGVRGVAGMNAEALVVIEDRPTQGIEAPNSQNGVKKFRKGHVFSLEKCKQRGKCYGLEG